MGHFPSTHWSLVQRAGAGSAASRSETRRAALAALIGRYAPALKAHLLARRRIETDRADDLVQGFIAREVLEDDLFANAKPGKGKFRSLLLTALDRYVISEIRYATRQKRHAGSTVPIESAAEPADGHAMPPQDVFDVAWAKQVLDSALARMDAECRESGRADVWGVFDARILALLVRGETPPAYEKMVEKLGIYSAAQASNLLVTAKRMFVRALRAVIAEYALSAAEIDAEIQDLQEILSRGARA